MFQWNSQEMITDEPDMTENKTLHKLTNVFFPLQAGSYLCFYLSVVRLCRNCKKKKKRKTCTYSIQVVLCMWGETNGAAPVLHRIAPTVPWVMHCFRLEISLENKIKQKEEFKMSGLLNRFNSLPVWFTFSYMTTTCPLCSESIQTLSVLIFLPM